MKGDGNMVGDERNGRAIPWWMRWRGGLTRTLLFAFLPMAIGPLLTLVIAGVFFFWQITQDQAINQLDQVAVLKEREIGRWLHDRDLDLAVLVSDPFFRQDVASLLDEATSTASYSNLLTRLENFHRQKTSFVELALLDAEDLEHDLVQVIVSTSLSHQEQETHSYDDDDYFPQVVRGLFLRPLELDPQLGTLTLLIGRPVSDEDGQVVGMLVGRIDLSDLDLMMLERAGLGATGETYLVNQELQAITQLRFGWSDDNILVNTNGVRQALLQQTSGSGRYNNYQGTPVFGVYRWLPELQVALLAERSIEEALTPMRQILASVVAIAVVGGVAVALMVVFVSQRISTPITHLTDAATQIAAGDLSQRVAIVRPDEIGALSAAFDNMADQMEDLIGTLEQQVAERTSQWRETNAHLRRQATRLEVIAQVGQAITSILNLDDLLARVVELIRAQFGYYDYHAGIFLLDKSGEWAVLRHAIGEAGQVMMEQKRQLAVSGPSIVSWVVRNCHHRIVRDADDAETGAERLERLHAGSEMALPLVVGDELLGVLYVNSAEEDAFGEEDVIASSLMADQIAIAIKNARLFGETKRRMVELGTLTEVGQALASTLRIEEVLQLIYAQTRRVMYAENMIIMLYDQERGEIECGLSNNPDEIASGDRFPVGTGMTSYIIEHRKSVLLRDNVMEEIQRLCSELAGHPTASWLGVPMMVGDHVLGVIIVQHYTTPNVYDKSHQTLLETIANQAATAIENAYLFEQVRREKQYSESLVLNSPTAIVVEDTNHKIASWNPAAEKLFGYAYAEAIGQNLDDLISTDAIRAEVVAYSDMTRSGNVVRAITQRAHRDRTMVDVELLAVPLVVEEEQIGTLVIYHNITELQRARQEAEAANQAKSTFLAAMSHEIRTPMNGVIGMTSLLLDTGLSAEQHEFTEIIRASGEALLTIINDILDFSKIEAGKMDLESQPFDLHDSLEVALDLVATKAAEKGLNLAYLVADDVPSVIVGDVTRLRQILINLFNNAVKFTEKGEVVVRVESELLVDDAGYELHFSVRDTGIGIPPRQIDRLFQSFSQVDASTTRRYGGTGLGLAISKRLSELMGGTMWVESPSSVPPSGGDERGGGGTGSIFHFTIRAKAALAPARAYRQSTQPQLSAKRVLIVDDNATNRHILTLQTQSWGMLPRATAFSSEALAWIRARILDGDPFDVAILDMRMPGMDGVSLASAIRQIETQHRLSLPLAHTATLPLVMLSSVGQRDTDIANDLFASYLTKPIKASQLYDVLSDIFAAKEDRPAGEHGVEVESQFDAQMGERHPLRILLAEDNAINQKLALRLLERMGYRADVAGNGMEAIEALQRQPYDVILMDVQMPEMDGLEATRGICRGWERAQRPRIIAMTANAMEEDREECLAAGMDDYVSKPIRVNELVGALSQCKPLVNPGESLPAPSSVEQT